MLGRHIGYSPAFHRLIYLPYGFSLPLSQVLDFNIPPVFPEILGYQTSVAVMGFVLAAQQARIFKGFLLDLVFYFSGGHKIDKGAFISRPTAALFL